MHGNQFAGVGNPLAGLNASSAANSIYQNQANAYAPPAEPPKTIASAIGHVERLNERLGKIREQVAAISDVIGGPRPTAGEASKNFPCPTGVVYRLNETADRAHAACDDIESLLSSIGRSLG